MNIKTSIKFKVILILVCIIIAVIFIEFLFLNLTLLPSFSSLEDKEAHKDIERVYEAVLGELENIDTICQDWAYWDDMYQFARSYNQDFIEANCNINTFQMNKLNMIYILDSSRNLIWGEIRQLPDGEKQMIPDLSKEAFNSGMYTRLFNIDFTDLNNAKVACIIFTKEGPMFISSRPILTSKITGPVNGFLIMGRLLSEEMIERFRKQTKIELAINLIPYKSYIQESRLHYKNILGGSSFHFDKSDPELISTHAVINDLFGKGLLYINVSQPRYIYNKGRQAFLHTLLSLILVAFLVLIVVIGILQKLLIDPILSITKHASRVEKLGDSSLRINLKRVDEIGVLSSQFNTMLDKIDKQKATLIEQSKTDGLTGLPNRRFLDEILKNEFGRMKRNQSSLSIIMCDIDEFKQFNDYYGHQQGDDCLKKVAMCLRQCLKRPADVVARYGGEEFLIVLPETSSEGARSVAENIKHSIVQLSIKHKMSHVSKVVTISMGIASVKNANTLFAIDELIKRADLALYEAKNKGRNRFEIKYM